MVEGRVRVCCLLQVNTFWFLAAQRLSVLLQLRSGDVCPPDTPESIRSYVAWLDRACGLSQQLSTLNRLVRLVAPRRHPSAPAPSCCWPPRLHLLLARRTR